MESHPSPVRNPWEEQTWTQRLHGWCKLSAGAATPMLKQYIYIWSYIITNRERTMTFWFHVPIPSISAWASLAHTIHQCSGFILWPFTGILFILCHSLPISVPKVSPWISWGGWNFKAGAPWQAVTAAWHVGEPSGAVFLLGCSNFLTGQHLDNSYSGCALWAWIDMDSMAHDGTWQESACAKTIKHLIFLV